MSVEEENKAIIKRTTEELNQGKRSNLLDLMTPDFVHHHKGGEKDYAFYKARSESQSDSRPNRQFIIDDMIAEGDRVALWLTIKDEGEEDKKGCFMHRFVNGKMAERWNMTSIQGHM